MGVWPAEDGFLLREFCLWGSSGAASLPGLEGPLATPWRYGGGGGASKEEEEEQEEEEEPPVGGRRLLSGEGGGLARGGRGAFSRTGAGEEPLCPGVGGRGFSRL